MMTCFLYGFSWFYGVKLFLKHLFSPCALFLGTMWLLTRMGALPERLGPEAYEAYVKPWIPREWTDAKLEVSGDKVKTYERKFWASVHRILPATLHPTCEKVFFAGILLLWRFPFETGDFVVAAAPPTIDSTDPDDDDSPPGRYPDADPSSHRPSDADVDTRDWSDADVDTRDWSDSESDDIDANTRSTLARMDLAA